jgi:heat-inducible transcriptional repressor
VSIVLSRYGVPDQLSGALAVVGPTHINYGRAISTVRHVSNLMTDMMVQLYKEELGDDANSGMTITPDKSD